MYSFKAAVLSAVVAVSALAGSSVGASADGLRLSIDEDGDARVGIEISDRYRPDRGWDERRGDDRRDWRDDRRPSCSPWRAEDKARNMGLRRARVVDVNGHRIVVQGHKWGDRQTVIFSRAPGCPVRAVF